MAHAFLTTGDLEKGIKRAISHAESTLGLSANDPANLSVHRYVNFTVDDVRAFSESAYRAPTAGDTRAVILAAGRLFHEAQNAMLKLFEEPPIGMTLYLVVPSTGSLFPTLLSRVQLLPDTGEGSGVGAAFLGLSQSERKKYLDRLVNRTRSDKPEEKREGRKEVLELVQDLTRELHKDEAFRMTPLMEDLASFTRILHDVSAPIKPICEHLLLVLPPSVDVHRL